MSRCTDCGFDWQMPHEHVLAHAEARLPRYRELVAPVLVTETKAEALRVRPSEAVWSPLEYLAHMRDVTEFFADRIERVLTEDRPVLHVRFRFAQLAELRSYRTDDPASVLTQFEERASDLRAMLEGLDDAQWALAGFGSGGDERTVLMLARRFAHEAHHHLRDIEQQLAAGT